MLTIEEVPAKDALGPMRSEWDSFQAERPYPGNATGYGSYYASEFLSRPIFLRATEAGITVAQWILCLRRTPHSRLRLIASTFSGPELGKGCSASYEEVFGAFVKYVLAKHHPTNIHVLSYALVRGVTEAALRGAGFQNIDNFHSHVNDLTDDEALMVQFGTTRRRHLRQALKGGYEYRLGVPIREYYPLSRESYARSNQRGPMLRTLRRLERHVAANGLAFIGGVYVNGKLTASSITVYRGKTAYYLYGATADDKAPGVATYLHYENMRHARSLGISEYDFGGGRMISEKDRSLSEFKRQFGGACISMVGGTYK